MRARMRPPAPRGSASCMLRARAVVLATGAIERPLLFADNDRPGVMLASAARAYVNRFAVAPGRQGRWSPPTATSAYRIAADLAAAGIAVSHVRRPSARAAGPARCPRTGRRSPNRRTRCDGRSPAAAGMVTAVDARAISRTGRVSALRLRLRRRRLVAAIHLASHTGVRPHYREEIGAFVPGDLPTGRFGAGSVMGAATTAEAVQQGLKAGREAASPVASPPAVPMLQAAGSR